MMKALLIVGSLLLSLPHVYAEDLESILTEASEPTPAANAKVEKKENASAKKVVSPLVLAMYEILGKKTSEQNIFLRMLEAEKWTQALLQFKQAFEGTEFQRSSNGRALLGLIQFKTGLQITGVETLFMAPSPKQIHPEIRQEWQKLVDGDHFVWGIVKVNWNPAWASMFGINPGIRMLSREVEDEQGIEKLKKLSEEAPDNSLAQSQIDWQLVLAYSMNDQADKAGKILAKLMKSEHAPVGQDLMNLTAARMLFQNGYFDSAIKLYEKVAKTSDYWTEAQEEIAWSYIRKGEPQNAMAVTQSLVKPSIASIVGPEAYFVHSLSQLKVCNYTGVADSLDSFSKVFKKRTLELNNLVAESDTKNIEKVIELMKAKELTYKDLGNQGGKLPSLLTRDLKMANLATAQKYLEAEAKAAEVIYAQSLGQTGLQASFENMKNNINQRAFNAKAASIQRIKDLAKTEVAETKDILKKMHIIEAEVLQQAVVADKIAKNAAAVDDKMGSTGSKATEVVKFPVESEFWFDEISNYKIDVKKPCVARR